LQDASAFSAPRGCAVRFAHY